MSIDIAASLNERQRDALLSYYLGQYVPASGNEDLVNLVQTPEDVYEYLLIDPLVSNAVPTSRVAQAMSSIQQYINGITMNMEPGYQTQYLDQDNITNWKDGLSQYDIWAGEVELDTYPENYIDPTLRQSQTAYFKDLITDLNQNTINNDTAQQAVMNYLNKFEQVANLTIVSGYLDSTDQTKGTYYFLGKSITSPVQYYWRSFDMSKNIDNVVSTDAWSEWYPMNTALAEDNVQGIPRLAYFNNRLYLFWFEKTTGGNATNGTNGETYDVITAYSSFCDFSNNWTSPFSMMSINNDAQADNDNDEHDNYCDILFSSKYLCTACGYNTNDNALTVSLYSGDTVETDRAVTGGYNDFSIYIDYWFNLTREKSSTTDDTASALSEYLFAYLETPDLIGPQQKIQSKLFYDKFVVGNVEPNNDVEYKAFVNSGIKLPDIDIDNVNVIYKADGKPAININIPLSTHLSINYKNSASVLDGKGTFYFDSYGDNGGKFKNMYVICSEEQHLYFNTVTVKYPYDKNDIPSEDTTLSHIYDVTAQTLYLDGEWIDSVPVNYNGDEYDVTFWNSQGEWSLHFTMKALLNAEASPWYLEAYSSISPSCWQSGQLIYTEQKNAYQSSTDLQTVTIDAFTDEQLNSNEVQFYFSFGFRDDSGYGVQSEYKIDLFKQLSTPVTPVISTRTDPNLGVAAFLQFTGSFEDGTAISPIRLNTLFAKELINKANVSIDDLINWDTQLTLEPGMTNDTAVPMDFSGANGIYFWELFFYMPYLVAWRLSQEEEYSDALSWYDYIFDPAARGRDNSSDLRKQYPERYLPFEGTGAISSWQIDFPNATSDEQQTILQNMSDVIIQVHYTARNGGSTFKQAVMNTL